MPAAKGASKEVSKESHKSHQSHQSHESYEAHQEAGCPSGYQLRYAAGLYWLLDMEQEGFPYRSPLPVNEIGACIWRMMEQGLGQEKIAGVLSEEYNVDFMTALEDVAEFQKQLQRQGVSVRRKSLHTSGHAAFGGTNDGNKCKAN